MVELTDTKTTEEASSSCCSTEAQATCCEPTDKAACCGESGSGGSCGCSAEQSTEQPDDVREAVGARYPAAATSVAEGGSCCDSNAGHQADMRQFTGCIAGALTRREFEEALSAAGLTDIEIAETHRVHDKASSAIVRARKPQAA
jgi:hypothetical protein